MVVQTQGTPRAERIPIVVIGADPATRREVEGCLRAGPSPPSLCGFASVEELRAHAGPEIWRLCVVVDGDGREYGDALEYVRAHLPDCPVVVVLGLDHEDRAPAVIRAGADDYVIRTTGYGERLQALVDELLDSRPAPVAAAIRDNIRALETNARQFKELVENAAEGVLIHVDETPVYANAALVRLLGFDRREDVLALASIYDFVDERDRHRVLRITRRLAAGARASDSYVFRARRRDGGLLWLENRVNPVTWQGYPAVQCTMADVSDRQRATNALRLAARVASRASEQPDFEQAIRVALRWLARGMGWEIAESWLPDDDDNGLVPGPAWCSDLPRFRRFLDSSATLRFRRNEGLPGRVWESGRPEWIANVSDAHKLFRRSILANAAGLRSGCGIPILAHGRTVAVLCFFMSAHRDNSRQVITALAAGTASLGPVLLQIRTEQALRASVSQTQTLISNNLDGILVVDDEDHIVFANPAAEQMFGRTQQALQDMPFGAPSLDDAKAEIEIHNARSGAVRVNEMRVASIDWNGKSARLVSLRDVTERREAQWMLELREASLRERVKELGCLYAVSEYLDRPGVCWEEVLRNIVDALPDGWHYPESTSARLTIESLEVVSRGFRESSHGLSRDITVDGEVLGRIEVFVADDHHSGDGQAFLEEEHGLIDELARRIGQAVSNRRYQKQLDASRQRFQDFAEAASDWLWEMDESLRFTYFSERIRVVTGQSPERLVGLTRQELAVVENIEDDPAWTAHLADLEARRAFRNFRYRVVLPEGGLRHIAISGKPVFDEAGMFRGYRGSGTDETGQVSAEYRAQELDRRLHGIADRLPGIVYQRLRKPDGSMEYPYLSAAITTLLGFEAGEVQNDPLLWTDRIHPEDQPRFHVALTYSARTLEPMDLQLRQTNRAGDERWFWHRSTPRRLADGDILWDCIELDITEQKQAEARVQYLGYHDQLTGLPNRELFVERVDQVLPIASRNGQPVAVAMLGLKRFKQVNEEFGMSGGDEVLRIAAARFGECLRPGDTVARLGGDRFLFLLPSVGADTRTHKPFERFTKVMDEPFTINRREILLSFNMGVALFPDDGDTAEELIQKADTAQAHYSRWGPGYGYTFYKDRMPESDTSRLAMEKELRDALDAGDQLQPFFQPLYDAVSGEMIAVETLARWMHPQRGLVPPGEFIQLAEDTGLVNPLGLAILRQACDHACRWERSGLPSITVAVNLSAKQLRDPDVAESIKRILQETGMPPQRLLLEVTESSLIADLGRGSQFMETLVAEGVRFALDDFGVGYSSLSYLGRLPVDTLKIDRSFIRELGSDPRGETTIKAIVALAHALELHVVAEGVEEHAQLEHVRRLGCETLQGFLLHRPMPAPELETLLARREPLKLIRDLSAPQESG